ncbi:MAG: TlpA family protein disulfide reductase [Flavobacteriales bacterium]|nr:TlpA family protein disulfide reductase [Flavobacteriales bacterium]MCB9364189.1 TlpA family protein disulfide reductase [Flavobacteriales bacterium]
MPLKSLLLFILSFTTLISFGSKTVIKGNVKDFDNQEITIYSYTDYFSENIKTIGYTNISQTGSFSFEFDCEEIQKVYLKIEDKTTWFFTQPGMVYNISLSYNEKANKQRVYDKQLSLNFNFPAPTELNQEVKKFNEKYDAFFDENYTLFVKRDRSVEPKIKAFKTKMLSEAENVKSPFVKGYIIYTIGILENSIDVSYQDNKTGKNSLNTKANIYTEYLHNKPILYNSTEYINFFKTFFKSEMKDLTLQVSGLDVIKAINEQASFSALSKALSKYPFLETTEFKELFAIYGLLTVSNDKYFNKENIIKMLKEVKTTSTFPQQKIIATELLNDLTKKPLSKGSKAPTFELTSPNGDLVSLSTFKGKPLYINFWSTWNVPSQKEMKVMEQLYKKYGTSVEFLSICTDNDFEKMTAFLAKNPTYNWSFLHLGKNQKLLETYEVKTTPAYYLLDSDLTILKAPAGRPGGTAERATEDNIEKDFFDLMNKR